METSNYRKIVEQSGLRPGPLGELIAFPQTPLLVGRGLAALSPRTAPSLSALWASNGNSHTGAN